MAWKPLSKSFLPTQCTYFHATVVAKSARAVLLRMTAGNQPLLDPIRNALSLSYGVIVHRSGSGSFFGRKTIVFDCAAYPKNVPDPLILR